MADPKKTQLEDEEWIGKPHPAEPDEIGKAHDPVVHDDEDRDEEAGRSVASDDRSSFGDEKSRSRGRMDGEKGSDTGEMSERSKT